MKSLLKILTCGSVDDGKSTLLGHLLYDAKLLFADQRDTLLLESKAGSRGGEIDYSLLLDGLAAEREQGITIDVAHRYFTTDKRSFIAADCPGHEEYTRNMAVGAGFAQLAVILIDATKGVLVQTRRHTSICALMGIRHFVYAVNKMDLAGYSEETFRAIEAELRALAAEFSPASLQLIPVSATEGDNVAHGSEHMPWYGGPTLQEYLEEVEVEDEPAGCGFCMPVQRVCRPSSEFRGFQGSIASGELHVGDELTVLPSGSSSRVARIVRGFDEVGEARSGQAVSVCLEDEVDVSRGCVLVRGCSPQQGRAFSVDLLWMDDAPLLPGKNFIFKLGTAEVAGTVLSIEHKVDVNTGEELPARAWHGQHHGARLLPCRVDTQQAPRWARCRGAVRGGGLLPHPEQLGRPVGRQLPGRDAAHCRDGGYGPGEPGRRCAGERGASQARQSQAAAARAGRLHRRRGAVLRAGVAAVR